MSNGGHLMTDDFAETLGKPKNELDAKLREEYLAGIKNLDAEISRRWKFKYRSYADYEREVRGASGLTELIALHGAPTTIDRVPITIGMTVYRVVSEYDPDEYSVYQDKIENMDFIFGKWMFKLAQSMNTYNVHEIYGTQLAATNGAIQCYQQDKDAIDVKIAKLREVS